MRIVQSLFSLLLCFIWSVTPSFAIDAVLPQTETVHQPYLGITPVFGRWNTAIPWVYNPTSAPALFADSAKMVSLLREAMAEWEGVSGVRFDYRGMDTTLKDVDSDGLVAVLWGTAKGAAATAGPSRSYTSVSAIPLGYDPYTDGSLEINRFHDWTGNGQYTTAMSERVLKSILVHELGHLIGLGHSDNPASIMFADPYNDVAHLLADDKAAAEAFYGPPANPGSVVAPYIPPSRGISPFTDSFFYLTSSGKDIPVTEINPTTADSDTLHLRLKLNGPLNQTIELHIVDPTGYVIREVKVDISCSAGDICSYFNEMGAVDGLKSMPGLYHVYVTSNNQQLLDHTFTVVSSPQWNRAPTASLSYTVTTTKAPFSVMATLTAADTEKDAISATWHIPGEGIVVENSVHDSVSRLLTFPAAGQYTVFVAVNDDAPRYTGSGRYSPADRAGTGVRTLVRQVITVTEPKVGPAIHGSLSGLALGDSIPLIALSASTGAVAHLTLVGTGSDVAFTLHNLLPAADYRLYLPTTTYVGGYWGGVAGAAASSPVSPMLAKEIDLSHQDANDISIKVNKGRLLQVTLNGLTIGESLELSAWSATSGMLVSQSLTATSTSMTTVLSGLSPVSDTRLLVQPSAAGGHQGGFYYAEGRAPSGFLRAAKLDFSQGDLSLSMTLEPGRSISGTVTNVLAGEMVRIEAWSDNTAHGASITMQGNGLYTLSGLPAADDYKVCVEPTMQAGGCYFGGDGIGLVPFSRAESLDLTSENRTGIDLSLENGRTISGTVGGLSETSTAWIEAFSATANHSAITQVKADGGFLLQGLHKAGDYQITVRAEGYKTPTQQRANLQDVTSTVVHFNLLRGSPLQGSILGLQAGEIATIKAYSPTAKNGKEITVRATDSAPLVYRLDGLADAEDYVVSLETANGQFFYAESASLRDRNQAKPVTCMGGNTVYNIDFDISAATSFTITGHISGLESNYADRVVTVRAWSAAGRAVSTHRAGVGPFMLKGMPAGDYYLTARASDFIPIFYNGSGWSYSHEQAATLPLTANVDSLQIPLVAGHTLSGIVTYQGSPVANAYISAWDNHQKIGGSAVSHLDGRYRITGLADGSYQITAQANEGRGVQAGVMLAASDLPNQALSLTKAAGSIRGITKAGSLLLLYKDNGDYRESALADSAGRYLFSGLEVGMTYRLDVDMNNQLDSVEVRGNVTLTLDKPEAIIDLLFVTIQTSLGSIVIALDPSKAPISVANFLNYVDAGFYDSLIFHRVIKNFMVQAGIFTADLKARSTQPPIRNEAENGLKNVRGTIAMARTTEVDSATSQFFINLVDNAFLNHGVRDFGYAVFGRVVQGLDVVDQIGQVATDSNDFPVTPITIVTVRRP